MLAALAALKESRLGSLPRKHSGVGKQRAVECLSVDSDLLAAKSAPPDAAGVSECIEPPNKIDLFLDSPKRLDDLTDSPQIATDVVEQSLGCALSKDTTWLEPPTCEPPQRIESNDKKLVSIPSYLEQPFHLDPERLEKIRQDDLAAAKLLSALFAENAGDDQPCDESYSSLDPVRRLLPNLDDDHIQLLTRLLTFEDWDRARITEATNGLGLMLDGALELINDAALDLTGSLLLMDVGDLEVDYTVASEMKLAIEAFRCNATST